MSITTSTNPYVIAAVARRKLTCLNRKEGMMPTHPIANLGSVACGLKSLGVLLQLLLASAASLPIHHKSREVHEHLPRVESPEI